MQPARQNQKRNDHHINVTLRSNDRNGKNLLANALVNYNWERLNRMDSVDSMVTFFNGTILTLLNTFLPVRIVRRHTSDKPWITDEFRRLIRRRQYAWTSGNHAQYRQLRNMINRQSKELKRQFCSKRVTDLRNCDSANWWRNTKKLIGQSNKSDLTTLAMTAQMETSNHWPI